MPRPKRLQEGWKSFAAACVPSGAPDVQRRAMEMAFYGGATVLLKVIMGMLDPGAEPTDADVQKMSDIEAELVAFAGLQSEPVSRGPIDPRVN